MFGIHVVTGTLLAVAAFGTTAAAHASNVDVNLRADIERIAQRRIFFGHQSVGVNLLDGVKHLAMTAGIPVRVDEVSKASAVESAMIGHSFIAENGNPFRKLESFEQVMGSQATGLDIALMKFCYVDFAPETDVKKLFARYRATIDSLHARNPGTTFVHVTAPLTVIPAGIKIRLKQLLGSAPPEFTDNLRREEYNALLRKTYQGREPIFDLARIESTAPDGSLETVEWKGSVVPVMVPAYTEDGGHLNAVGQLRAARELVSVLASIPDRKQHNDNNVHR
jgi:hypothetical protein